MHNNLCGKNFRLSGTKEDCIAAGCKKVAGTYMVKCRGRGLAFIRVSYRQPNKKLTKGASG
jgi:hypothetical protein